MTRTSLRSTIRAILTERVGTRSRRSVPTTEQRYSADEIENIVGLMPPGFKKALDVSDVAGTASTTVVVVSSTLRELIGSENMTTWRRLVKHDRAGSASAWKDRASIEGKINKLIFAEFDSIMVDELGYGPGRGAPAYRAWSSKAFDVHVRCGIDDPEATRDAGPGYVIEVTVKSRRSLLKRTGR